MTAQTWIDATRDMLLTDYVEEHATLAALLNGTDTVSTVSFLYPAAVVPGVVPGVVIESGTELMYVYSVTTAGLATVQRGFRGSTTASHAAGDVVTVNPKFPAYKILSELNNDLADLASPANGLYQMASAEFTFNSSQDGYDLAGVTGDVLSVYQVTWSETGAETAEPLINNWSLRRTRNTTDFPSGYALVLHDDAESGRTVRVLYKTSFTALTDSTTALSTVGLPSSAYDLPAVGAALRLMATRPVRREFLDEQGSSREAQEVPPGAIEGSMRDLRQLRQNRVAAEAARLDAAYPTVWQRAGGVSRLLGSVT